MIYTFYSYKGGVGRSMALVNVAELMCRAGLKVFMLDWDLEAPGLERFYPDLVDDILTRPGVMEMLATYKERALCFRPDEGKPLFPVDNIWSYAVDLHPDDPGPGRLWLVPAGYRAGGEFLEYANRVKGFDWKDFYQNWAGEAYIDWLREHLEASADVILVDSRTGVTEMGGVCAYQLADVVVMLCAANEQNMDGTQQMLQSFTDPRLPELRHKRPLASVVVPARIETTSQLEERNEFHDDFRKRFASCIPAGFRRDPDFFRKCEIPYMPFYAFQELIAVNQIGTNRRAVELESAYGAILAVLASLSPEESAIRQHLDISLPERLGLERRAQAETQARFEEALSAARLQLDQSTDLESLRKAERNLVQALSMPGFEQNPQGRALSSQIQLEMNRYRMTESLLSRSTQLMREGEFRGAAEMLAQADAPKAMREAYQRQYKLAQALAVAEAAERRQEWRHALHGYRVALEGDPLLERTVAIRIEHCQDILTEQLAVQVRQLLDRWPLASDEAQTLLIRARGEGWFGTAQQSLLESLLDEVRDQQMARQVVDALERSPRDTASAFKLVSEARRSVRSAATAERLAAWELLIHAAESCELARANLNDRDLDAAKRALDKLRTGPIADLPLLDDLQHDLDQAGESAARQRFQQELNVALTKGHAALSAGNLQTARLSFERVLQMDPDHIDAKMGLLAVLSKAAAEAEKQGRNEEAAAYFDAALHVDPNNVEIRERKRHATVPSTATSRWRYVLLVIVAMIMMAVIIWIILKLTDQASPALGNVAPVARAISDSMGQTLRVW